MGNFFPYDQEQRFSTQDYQLGLPSYQRQGFADMVMNFPQVQAAQATAQPGNQQESLKKLWMLQQMNQQQPQRNYSPWDALAQIANTYVMSRSM